VLIVDEAQNLTDEVLEEIRMLTNLETLREAAADCAGRPTELEAKLKQPQLRQLRQRLTLRPRPSTDHRRDQSLCAAAAAHRRSDGRQIFDPETLAAIHRYAMGIPRVVNLLCEHCLVSAFVDQKATIASDVVDAVARDFELDDSTASAATTASPKHPAPGNLTWSKRYAPWPRWPTACASEQDSPRKEVMSRIHEALKRAEQERAASKEVVRSLRRHGLPVMEARPSMQKGQLPPGIAGVGTARRRRAIMKFHRLPLRSP